MRIPLSTKMQQQNKKMRIPGSFAENYRQICIFLPSILHFPQGATLGIAYTLSAVYNTFTFFPSRKERRET